MKLHPDNCRWLVTARGPDGESRSHNMTAHIGTKTYDERMVVIRHNLPDDWTLDTTAADQAHQRMLAAKERYKEAEVWWMGDTLGRPHPGALSEYMEDE